MIEPITSTEMRLAYALVRPSEDLRMFALLAMVGEKYGLKREQILAKTRRRKISHPRQEFMLHARRSGHSTQKIADFLGLKDHTTVLHGSRAAAKRMIAEARA